MYLIYDLLVSLIVLLLRGLLLKKLWLWFIVSHFQINPLNLGIAMGLALLIEASRASKTYSKNEINEIKEMESKDHYFMITLNALAQGISLLVIYAFGAIIHGMM